MCGITGYVGRESALPFIMQGLFKLEYRGYDSAGLTLVDDDKLITFKVKGRLDNLKELLKDKDCPQLCGIGHTRWATHGIPSQLNSHPHTNQRNTISLVHNGIIENYLVLKDELIKKNYEFKSQTDTEIIVQLLDYYYYHEDHDLFKAFLKVVKRLEGSFGICVVSTLKPDTIYIAKKESPMVVGKNEDACFCASDVPALLSYTKKILALNDSEVAILNKDEISLYDFDGKLQTQNWLDVPYDLKAAQKGGYDSFMLKEIHEQTKAIKDTLRGKIIDNEIVIDGIEELKIDFKKIKRIYFIACGTAYHACIYASLILQEKTLIPIIALPASEFRYRKLPIDNEALCIFVSQSGETADTIAALKIAKKEKAITLAIVNALGSSISRIADSTLYTCAGPEISVASTKAYTTQLVLLLCLDIYLNKKINQQVDKELINDLKELPKYVEEMLKYEKDIKELAKLLNNQHDAYFIGRNLDYPSAVEGALKLKEVSYIHADAYYAGELKHGPIALIEKDSVVIAIASQKAIANKTISNIEETISRGARVILITTSDDNHDNFSHIIKLPKINEKLLPILSIIPLQLLAYYVAKNKGVDIDKPRNLAKSVTVE